MPILQGVKATIDVLSFSMEHLGGPVLAALTSGFTNLATGLSFIGSATKGIAGLFTGTAEASDKAADATKGYTDKAHELAGIVGPLTSEISKSSEAMANKAQNDQWAKEASDAAAAAAKKLKDELEAQQKVVDENLGSWKGYTAQLAALGDDPAAALHEVDQLVTQLGISADAAAGTVAREGIAAYGAELDKLAASLQGGTERLKALRESGVTDAAVIEAALRKLPPVVAELTAEEKKAEEQIKTQTSSFLAYANMLSAIGGQPAQEVAKVNKLMQDLGITAAQAMGIIAKEGTDRFTAALNQMATEVQGGKERLDALREAGVTDVVTLAKALQELPPVAAQARTSFADLVQSMGQIPDLTRTLFAEFKASAASAGSSVAASLDAITSTLSGTTRTFWDATLAVSKRGLDASTADLERLRTAAEQAQRAVADGAASGAKNLDELRKKAQDADAVYTEATRQHTVLATQYQKDAQVGLAALATALTGNTDVLGRLTAAGVTTEQQFTILSDVAQRELSDLAGSIDHGSERLKAMQDAGINVGDQLTRMKEIGNQQLQDLAGSINGGSEYLDIMRGKGMDVADMFPVLNSIANDQLTKLAQSVDGGSERLTFMKLTGYSTQDMFKELHSVADAQLQALAESVQGGTETLEAMRQKGVDVQTQFKVLREMGSEDVDALAKKVDGGTEAVARMKELGYTVPEMTKKLKEMGIADFGAVGGSIEDVQNKLKAAASADVPGLQGAITTSTKQGHEDMELLIGAVKGIQTELEKAANNSAPALTTALNNIPKTVDVQVRVNYSYPAAYDDPNYTGDYGAGTTSVPGMASGGDVLRAGWAMVGEQGPELAYLPQGAHVQPLGGLSVPSGGGGGDVYIQVPVNGPVFGMADVQRMIEAAVTQTVRRGGLDYLRR